MLQETTIQSSSQQKNPPKKLKKQEKKQVVLNNLSDYKIFEEEKQNNFYSIYTVSAEYVPDWYGHSEYIIKGYRRVTNSYIGATKSLLYLHNETGNILTHGIGSIGFVVLMIWFYSFFSWMGWKDDLVMFCFFIGAIGCLTLSTLFHLFCCHSRHVSSMWNKADYIGIVVLIIGSFVPIVYYGFYCSRIHQTIYLAMILVFGAATISISVSSYFATPQYRFLRTGLFSSMGLSGIAPLVNGVIIYGFPLAKLNFAVDRVILMGALYILGAFIYAFRIPERWFPDFSLFSSGRGLYSLYWGATHAILVAGK